jgi:uncharacterized protein (DUF934 family)
MPERVIRNRRVEDDRWLTLGAAENEEVTALPAGPVIVPLAVWKGRRDELAARGDVGVWLRPEDDPDELLEDFGRVALIAVHFPKFGDGRGYSTAALLRRRGYRGELRAFGDIGRDHLYFLARVGFDAFRLPGHRDPEAALASLGDFTLHYQGSIDDPQPLFRRRALEKEEAR